MILDVDLNVEYNLVGNYKFILVFCISCYLLLWYCGIMLKIIGEIFVS